MSVFDISDTYISKIKLSWLLLCDHDAVGGKVLCNLCLCFIVVFLSRPLPRHLTNQPEYSRINDQTISLL